MTFSGAAVGGVLAVAGAPLLIAAFPVLIATVAGWAVVRTFRSRVQRAQLGLERALDELERRPALSSGRPGPPNPGGLARGVGRVVRDITQEVRKALDE